MIEEIKKMSKEQLNERAMALAKEIGTADAERLSEIDAELTAIEERREELRIEARAKAAAAVAGGQGTPVPTPMAVETRTTEEVRNSHEYAAAYVAYIKAEKAEKARLAEECRTLLTVNAPQDGSVPVPARLEGRIRTAWDNDEIFRRLVRTYVAANLEVGFEVSATDAAWHEEGANAPSEEELVLGIVTLIPKYAKKWIKVSDTVLSMGPEEFLDYLYDELIYRIIKLAADTAVGKIVAAPAQSTTTKVGVPVVGGSGSVDDIIDAEAELSDEARDVVVLMHRKTAAALKKAAKAAHYDQDPFDDLEYIPCNFLDPVGEADDGDCIMIVGDLRALQANLPEGENVIFKFDDLSLAEKDLVKIVGKLNVAIEITGPGMLCKVLKGDIESES
jgi:HK97 family phage major capsid protein